MIKFLSDKELEKMTTEEKIRYFEEMKEYCLSLASKPKKSSILARNFVRLIYPPIVRRYGYERRKEENIPKDGKAIFLCNHSNSHDFFTPLEVLHEIGLEPTVLAANDDLDKMTEFIFSSCNGTLANRNEKKSTQEATIELCSKMLASNGVPSWIYGESTWNLHPFKLMHDLKRGGAFISAITGYPIIPTIIEYVEVPEIVTHENELYKKCIVTFGKPIYISREHSLIGQIADVQEVMKSMRAEIRTNEGTLKTSLAEVVPQIYLNHTYLKKFDAFGYTYDSRYEQKYLLSKDGCPVENEFTLDEFGNLVPGITEKEKGTSFIITPK